MSASYISIDWGGSHLTGNVIFDGTIISAFNTGAGNIRQLTPQSLLHTCQVIREKIAKEHLSKPVIMVGAAGGGDEQAQIKLRKALLEIFPEAEEIAVYSDYECNHAACFNGGDGILSINGTGSVIFARSAERVFKRGGWGYILDEMPSGAYFGRAALSGVLRYLEGNPEYHGLYESYRATWGDPCQQEIIDSLYRSSAPQKFLGRFSPVLTMACSADCKPAAQIIEDSVVNLVKTCESIVSELKKTEVSFCGSGGLWQQWPELTELFSYELKKHNLPLKIRKAQMPLTLGPLAVYSRTRTAEQKLLLALVEQEIRL